MHRLVISETAPVMSCICGADVRRRFNDWVCNNSNTKVTLTGSWGTMHPHPDPYHD